MDRLAIQVAFAMLPGLLWLSWARRQDRTGTETAGRLLWVFTLGCFSAFAVLLIRWRWERLVESATLSLDLVFVDAFVVTAALEEWCKGMAFGLGARRKRANDDACAGLIYGVAAGLGFASVENLFYLQATGEPMVVILRSFTALLVHVGCSGLLGHALWRVRMGASRWRGLATFVEVVLLHGLYNLFLISFPEARLIALLMALPLLLVIFSWHFRHACDGRESCIWVRPQPKT
ncbi:MAG: PrsW family intramembrane metalloprotease [Planctomycetes bacterium]|nr:PrsW family intramembrane metalloprotease [Planctomycetota bacterium]